MIGLFDGLKMGAAAIAVSVLIYPVAHKIGKSAGEREAKTAALETTIELLKSRELTNAEITGSDAVALCAHYGLQDDDTAECLRRVAAATADAGNSRENHDGR